MFDVREKIRLFHLCLAGPCNAAFLTGEALAQERRYGEDRSASSSGRKAPRLIKKVHEATGNPILLFVALHVAYLLLFRRPFCGSCFSWGPTKS